MNILHKAEWYSPKKVCEIYSERDGVPISYVCSSELPDRSMAIYDIYYRETPHPEFGNHYFGLTKISQVAGLDPTTLMITNADSIDNCVFGMIWDEDRKKYRYSRYRHDYVSIGGNVIDGGRAYVRGTGYELFRLTDGLFEKE